ncbi:hypothetical protein F2P81_016831 [Scophthalmus maximus]|uniref:Uncharacterized protein n=1 Tax=Scophthalmus maximus TaxID=52904 RepID=A0A6A4SE51_SCOMX|nr:hypothetical protein F2P81_016831 [Scophthalmus maximus]
MYKSTFIKSDGCTAVTQYYSSSDSPAQATAHTSSTTDQCASGRLERLTPTSTPPYTQFSGDIQNIHTVTHTHNVTVHPLSIVRGPMIRPRPALPAKSFTWTAVVFRQALSSVAPQRVEPITLDFLNQCSSLSQQTEFK